MCLIIHKPKDGHIEKWIIESAAQTNPDGVGIMSQGIGEKWTRIKNRKVYDKVNSLGNAAIHFRWRTHGDKGLSNVHPFTLRDGRKLMHNGIFQKYSPSLFGKDKNKSDTANFVDKFCNGMIEKCGKLDLHALESEVGYSAVALMHPSGRITRHGSGWNEYEGCMYSNEYAWDCPHAYVAPRPKIKKWLTEYNASTEAALDHYDAQYQEPEASNASFYSSTDAMIEGYLFSAMHDLPLQDEYYIARQDIDLYDKMWDQFAPIEIEDFIADCSAETKLNLFVWMHDKGYITS